MSELRTRLMATAILIGAFIAGAMTSAVLDRKWIAPVGATENPMEVQARLALFQEELDLDDEQVEQVERILLSARADMAALMDEVQPRLNEIRSRHRRELHAVLRPDQQEQYDGMRDNMRRRMQHLHNTGDEANHLLRDHHDN